MKEGITHDLRTISQRNRRFGALCGAEQILGEDPRSEPVSALISRGNIKCLGGVRTEDPLGGCAGRCRTTDPLGGGSTFRIRWARVRTRIPPVMSEINLLPTHFSDHVTKTELHHDHAPPTRSEEMLPRLPQHPRPRFPWKTVCTTKPPRRIITPPAHKRHVWDIAPVPVRPGSARLGGSPIRSSHPDVRGPAGL